MYKAHKKRGNLSQETTIDFTAIICNNISINIGAETDADIGNLNILPDFPAGQNEEEENK